MTAPRQILPGTTWHLTRRCSERRFFLRPDGLVNETFLYVLAVAAQRFGMQIHAMCVMSNHYHLLATDPFAQCPLFMQFLNSLVARAINLTIGHSDGFWSAEASYGAVEAGDRDTIVHEAAYILANPCAAGLVSSGREWPGIWTAPEKLGSATYVARRPGVLFREDGSLPDSVELTLTVPPGFESAGEFQALVEAAWEEREVAARNGVNAEGRRFVGRAGVLALDPFAHAVSSEPLRKPRPRVAASETRTRKDLLARLRAFLGAYREAFASLRAGVRNVVFPAGTYKLRVELGVRCEAFG